MNFVRKVMKLLCISVVVSGIDGYRILGIFPLNSKSHNGMFEPLMKGLAKRGHQVDIISHFEPKNPPENYKIIINLEGSRPALVNNMKFENAYSIAKDPLTPITTTFGNDLCELMSLEEMQRFIKNPPNDPPYDLVITEAFAANCYIGFGYILKVPVITVSSILEFPWAISAIGNPASTAFAANVFMHSFFISTFSERVVSTFAFHIAKLKFNWYTEEAQTEAMRKYLSSDIPGIREIERSVTLMLTNYHHSLFGVRPVVPAVVDIAGIHAEENADEFTPELKRWMDESVQGVVYFTFGSMVLMETLPEEILLAFYASFSKITPIRVLMKVVKKENLPPGLPNNILLSSWIPQVPVLKHNNTKVFITHGGLMGTQEALYYGVPMIGIPIFTDQFSNVEIYVKKNMAIRMVLQKINEETLDKALNLTLNDPKFKEAAQNESKLFRDRPMSAMDTATYWIEYIIRNGAGVIKCPAVDMYWWQLELLDVYGFLILCFVIFICLAKLLLEFVIRRIYKIFKEYSEYKKKHKFHYN